MKKLTILLLCCWSQLFVATADSTDITILLEEWEKAINIQFYAYEMNRIDLLKELNAVNHQLEEEGLAAGTYVRLLNHKLELKEELSRMEEFLGVELTRLRYKKGMELIRLLYEKVLGLDHHFSSLQTYQKIISLSNPNAYPEFQRTKVTLEKRLKRENALKLPAILETNPYLSPAFSLITSVLGSGSTTDREKDLDDISCILDFTARMNSELSTIYYETEYLKESNTSLKEDCIKLFEEYVGLLGYHTALDICRREDDWESVYNAFDGYMEELQQMIEQDPNSSQSIKKQINLEFSVDRLINFINVYNSFIAQGSKYYAKFEIIVTNYPNEKDCVGELPYEFENLKRDIQYSIDRFNEAYDIAALKGSKLKDLLYGFSD